MSVNLEPLLSEVVFVGGAVLELYITQPVSERIRATRDTDVVCEIASYVEYGALGTRLRAIGFTQDAAENDPPYRWRIGEDVVDVMPTREEILGFVNRWYAPGLKRPATVDLSDDCQIQILTAPYFLASKVSAFLNRGRSDPYGSTDFEDMVVLLANRPELVQEIGTAEHELRDWLRARMQELFPPDREDEYLAAHLPVRTVPGAIDLVLGRLRDITGEGR